MANEKLIITKKNELFEVSYTSEGQKLVIINGLDSEQAIEHGPIQLFLIDNIDTFMVMYWLLILGTATYLIGVHIVLPLLKKNSEHAAR